MRVLVKGIALAVDVLGRGVPVLWIHGYPLNRSLWAPQAAALADCARAIVPDLRGFGESDAPDGVYTMGLFAADLVGLLDFLGVERVVVAGLSMGGYVALALARLYPQRLLGLILADTRAGPDTPEAARGRTLDADRALGEGVEPVVRPMLAKLLAPATQQSRPDLVQTVERMLLSSRPAGVAGALLGMAGRPDSRPLLAQIAVPTLAIGGEEDVITPPAELERIAAGIPSARLALIRQAGHLSNLEQPETFNRYVREFLTSAFPPAGPSS